MDITIIWVFLNGKLFPRFVELVLTPFIQKELLWLVVPLLFILIFMQIYFGRNRTEEMGWNTAFGNSVTLFWIVVILLKFTIESVPKELLSLDVFFTGEYLKDVIMIGILAIWTITLLLFDFFHSLPKKIAFFLSSSVLINTTAYIFISIILGNIILDKITVYAGLFFIIFSLAFFKIFRTFIRPSKVAKIVMTRKKHEKEQERLLLKVRLRNKIYAFKEKVKYKIHHLFDFMKGRPPNVE